jgi:hypothetical protein
VLEEEEVLAHAQAVRPQQLYTNKFALVRKKVSTTREGGGEGVR